MSSWGILSKRSAHGYELKSEYVARFPISKPLAFGQVYSTLTRLRRDGLVEIRGRETDRGPERLMYTITPAGQEELERWLTTAEPNKLAAPDVTLQTVVTLLHTGDGVTTPLSSLTARYREHVATLDEAVSEFSDRPIQRLAADYELVRARAQLRWLESATAMLATENQGGLEDGSSIRDPGPACAT